MKIKNYLFLLLFFNISFTNADEGLDVINRVKDVLKEVTEAKQIKESNLQGYPTLAIGNKAKLSNIDSGLDINSYISKFKEFAKQDLSLPEVNLNSLNTANQVRDPFNLSGQANSRRAQGGFGSSFLPGISNTRIPELKLKGVINHESNKPEELLALLEIGKKDVYMVRVGDEISYDPRDPNAAIKIIKINRLTVTVQAGSLGNFLIVR